MWGHGRYCLRCYAESSIVLGTWPLEHWTIHSVLLGRGSCAKLQRVANAVDCFAHCLPRSFWREAFLTLTKSSFSKSGLLVVSRPSYSAILFSTVLRFSSGRQG